MKKTTTPHTSKKTIPGPSSAPVAPAGAMWAAGIDLGDKWSHVCIYGNGSEIAHFRFPMLAGGLREAFEGKGYAKVVVEAGSQSAWVTRDLRALGYDPIVANPRKLKAISSNERKSDQNDARMLAKLALADESLLYPIQHRTAEQDRGMAMLKSRDLLVRQRTKTIAAVRATAKGAGRRIPSGSPEAFGEHQKDIPVELQLALNPMFAVVAALNTGIHTFDIQLEDLAAQAFPETEYLLQVAGVGTLTSLAFVLAVGDPARFKSGRMVAAYFGLVPRRDQSGDCDKQLGISKTGNGFVRRLLVQCSQIILGSRGADCDLRRWGQKIAAHGGKKAKKRAVIAVARKLTVLLFRLWRDKLTWKPLFNVQETPATSALVPEEPSDSRSLATAPRPPTPCEDTNVVPKIAAPPVRIPACTGSTETPQTSADRSVDTGRSSKNQQSAVAPDSSQQSTPAVQTTAGAEDDRETANADGDRGWPLTVPE
jgi:transposase